MNIESIDISGDTVSILFTDGDVKPVVTLHLSIIRAVELANSLGSRLKVNYAPQIENLKQDLEVARREILHYTAELKKANDYMKRQSNNSFQMGD